MTFIKILIHHSSLTRQAGRQAGTHAKHDYGGAFEKLTCSNKTDSIPATETFTKVFHKPDRAGEASITTINGNANSSPQHSTAKPFVTGALCVC